MDIQTIRKNPKQFLSLTGFNIEIFDMLLSFFEHEYIEYFAHFTLSGTLRIRRKITRKDSVFKNPEEALFFILVYLKTNPLQEKQAADWGLSQPQCNVWIKILIKLIYSSLAKTKRLPARSDKSLVHVLKDIKTVFIDATNRPIQKSLDYQTQKEHFNGQKKTCLNK